MTQIFLSVPMSSVHLKAEDDIVQTKPKDAEEHSRIGDAMRVLVGRAEMQADPENLKNQIVSYIDLIRDAISKADSKTEESLGVSSVKLGLTVTVGGNIGLASAEAEASIEIEFSQKPPNE